MLRSHTAVLRMYDLQVMNARAHGAARTVRSAPAILLGAAVALGIPATSIAVSALWSWGAIQPDPNGALVQLLQALGLPALMLGPLGLVIGLWAAGARSIAVCTIALVYGLPVLAVIWFVSVAWLGGLAGEPF